jgi:hypothetical protein
LSKSPRSSSLRDWFDANDELGSSAVLGATALHVAAEAAAGGTIPPVVMLPDSLAREPAAPEPARPEKPGGGASASKKRSQSAPSEPAQKRKKPKPMVKDQLPPKGKKVTKRKATEVDG